MQMFHRRELNPSWNLLYHRTICLHIFVVLGSQCSIHVGICMFRWQFTFSIKHLRDVQELFSHLEGSVQVTNGVVLQRHTSPRRLTEQKRELMFVSLLSQTLRKEMIAGEKWFCILRSQNINCHKNLNINVYKIPVGEQACSARQSSISRKRK